jgi:hypothetical protein
MEVTWTFTASTRRLGPQRSRERDRHYAGWAGDLDNAKLHANEIYEGRESTEAVVVIGNGPTGVEVVYRLDGANWGRSVGP